MRSSIRLVDKHKPMVDNSTTAHTILPAEGRMRAPVHIYASPRLPLDMEEKTALTRLSEMPFVEKIVALPDLHVKPRLETPSSLAVAVRDHLILGLSSPSPNCGMAAALTGLNWEDVSEDQLDELFSRLAESLPLKPLVPLISKPEMDEVLVKGPRALLDRFGFFDSILDGIDQPLSPFEQEEIDSEYVLKSIPESLRNIGRAMFGQVGKGNHFLELQVVDRILNASVAKSWGLAEGQVLFMYHADSGYLGAFVGRMYAHRMKNNWRGRLFEWRLKLPHHISHGSNGRFLQRVKSYMLPRRFAVLAADSEEARMARTALWAAGNYADANRLAILAAIRNAFLAVWLAPGIAPDLLWDAPHNGIRQERIDGEQLWVHRHNAVRVIPPSHLSPGSKFAETGHPVLLPGTERTLSFLCSSGEGAGKALFSADHGAGRSALRLARSREGSSTRVYGYGGPPASKVLHFSEDGVLEVLDVLSSADIAHPVAALRPAAVLKANS
jgi:tRNA-splicing ligase RtcB (3'-phosphate/5'-hydroxy nucleic acid ligase)